MVDTFLQYSPDTDRHTSLPYLPCFSVSSCLLMRLSGVCTPTSLYFCSLTCVLCLFLSFCVKTFHATGTNHCLLFCTKTTHAPESTSSKLVHRLISLLNTLNWIVIRVFDTRVAWFNYCARCDNNQHCPHIHVTGVTSSRGERDLTGST